MRLVEHSRSGQSELLEFMGEPGAWRRATVLLWAHNYAFIGKDWIVGDAFLVGPVGRDGADTTTPELYLALLLEARYYRLELQMALDGSWYTLGDVFNNVLGAYAAAIELAYHPAVEEVQVVGMA